MSMVVMNQDPERARSTDFVCVHGASIVLVRKEPWKCYDHEEVFQAISEVDWPKAQGYWAWLYPPTALFFIWPLGWLSYGWAQIVWFMVQFALMIGIYGLILGHGRSLGGILGYPGVAINVSYGQNGLFSGGIVGLGFLLLVDYPAIAGAVLSLVACKPHLALLIPVALVAGRERRAFWGFVGFALLWHAASVWAFGWASWELWVYQAFAHVEWYADSGVTLPLEVVPSVYGAACMRWEQPLIPLILQAYVGLTAVCTMVSVWWRDRRIESRIVTLVSATLLASPKVVTYDLIGTLPMLAFWVSKDGDEAPTTADCWLLALTWLLPTLSEPIARRVYFQLAPLLLLLWLWRVERYSRTEKAMPPPPWGA
jgi:hypothetical protein